MKLEGKDVDCNYNQTVEKQVFRFCTNLSFLKRILTEVFCDIIVCLQIDTIIEEATNLDNLALLYEGWTPWV